MGSREDRRGEDRSREDRRRKDRMGETKSNSDWREGSLCQHCADFPCLITNKLQLTRIQSIIETALHT